jgi:glycosyltransferase involved in cell wall biosynthesis
MSLRTLYLCYFGLREPLVQTQVLPYLKQLSADGEVEVFLLTFEPNQRDAWSPAEELEWRELLARQGIRWFSLPYHKSPSILVTPYDIMRGAWTAAGLARRFHIDVLHARGHIPMAMALLAKRWCSVRLVFDIRGLLAEEYEEAGVWKKHSPQFRAVRAIERAGLKHADQIIVLTRRLRDSLVERELARAGQIEVIPCCVEFARFQYSANNGEAPSNEPKRDAQSQSEKSKLTERFEVVSAGSVTGLYLLKEMGRFFLSLKVQRPDAFFRILTMSSAEDAAATLMGIGLDQKDFLISAVSPTEVPSYLRRARLGLSFRKATYSQMAASPTKIAEYLAAGLPVVCNAGIGDTEELLASGKVGVILRGFDEESLITAASEALALADETAVKARCVETAYRYFDLANVGGAGYRNVYRRFAEGQAGAPARHNVG